VQGVRDLLERRLRREQGGEQRRLARIQAVRARPRDAGAVGHVVHREPSKAVPREELHRRREDPLARARVPVDVEGVQQRGPRREVPVERGPGDAGVPGDHGDRRAGICGERPARRLDGGGLPWFGLARHDARLDATTCLV
jgi:hypothetical protein